MKLVYLIVATILMTGSHSMRKKKPKNVCNNCPTQCTSWISQACSSYITMEAETTTITSTKTFTPTPQVISYTVKVTYNCTPSYVQVVKTISPSCTATPLPPPSHDITYNTSVCDNAGDNIAGLAGNNNTTPLAVLGSFTLLLALLLVVTITGWICTAIGKGRRYKSSIKSKVDGGSMGLHNPVYGAPAEGRGPTEEQSVRGYSTQGPAYERVGIDTHNGYDVIDRRPPPPVSHTHNNARADQDYSVLDSGGMEHDYHVLEDAGGGLGVKVQEYEVPLMRRQ